MIRSTFITGAGSGLGAAFALESAKLGWRLGLCGRSADSLSRIADEVLALGGKPEIFVVDVVNASLVSAAIAYFRPDSLLCCAAILGQDLVPDLTPDRFANVMAINVQGTYNACRAAMIGWQKDGSAGDIVTVSSLGGLRGQQRFPGFVGYAASKHAIVGLTEALAFEGRMTNIRVNAVAPGAFQSGMSLALGSHPRTQAKEIVPTIHYLFNRPQSGALNGTTIEVQCHEI